MLPYVAHCWLLHARELCCHKCCHVAPCRHLFETTARKLLADNPRAEFVYGVTATGLVFGEEGVHDAAAATDSPAASGGQQYNTVTGMPAVAASGGCVCVEVCICGCVCWGADVCVRGPASNASPTDGFP
jgi:hypothetical protein